MDVGGKAYKGKQTFAASALKELFYSNAIIQAYSGTGKKNMPSNIELILLILIHSFSIAYCFSNSGTVLHGEEQVRISPVNS